METKQCAVRGLLFAPRGRMPGAMCEHIIVGSERCGYEGQCKHKRDAQLAQTERAAQAAKGD